MVALAAPHGAEVILPVDLLGTGVLPAGTVLSPEQVASFPAPNIAALVEVGYLRVFGAPAAGGAASSETFGECGGVVARRADVFGTGPLEPGTELPAERLLALPELNRRLLRDAGYVRYYPQPAAREVETSRNRVGIESRAGTVRRRQ